MPLARIGRPPLSPRPDGRSGRSPVVKVPLKDATLAELRKRAGPDKAIAFVARRILERATKT